MTSRYWVVAVTAIIAIIVGLVLFFSSGKAPDEPVDTAPPVSEPLKLPSLEDLQEPAAEIMDLPQLNVSDAFVREQAKRQFGNVLSRLFAVDELVRKFTFVIESIAGGGVPHDALEFLAPQEKVSVARRDGKLYLNPESYARFDAATGLFASVDADQAVAFLRITEPLVEQAYAELGVRSPAITERIVLAIDQLLATPVVTDPIELVRPSVMYKFADRELEALPPIQKQLLRIGPDNSARLRARLEEFRALLLRP